MGKKPIKTEAELILTVPNVDDWDACSLYAQRARLEGMFALAAACEERLKQLRPMKKLVTKKMESLKVNSERSPKKTLVTAERALTMLIDDYVAGLGPTTYGELAIRCGFEGQQNGRWFGQVTDLIDAACALANVPSFALVRVREANGEINHAAWRKQYPQLRGAIIAKAEAGRWTDQDFTKIRDTLAVFSSHDFGNKKAWGYVYGRIDIEGWAGVTG